MRRVGPSKAGPTPRGAGVGRDAFQLVKMLNHFGEAGKDGSARQVVRG